MFCSCGADAVSSESGEVILRDVVSPLRDAHLIMSELVWRTQAIYWAIMLNVIVIAMGGYNIGERKTEVLENIGLVLTVIFAAEAWLKIAVLGAKHYFRSR